MPTLLSERWSLVVRQMVQATRGWLGFARAYDADQACLIFMGQMAYMAYMAYMA